MNGEKLRVLMKAFGNLLRYLNENDRLSIVSFSIEAKRVTNLMKMTSENKKNTLKAL